MSAQYTNFQPKNLALFDESSAAYIMGILNITTDSFYDGGKFFNELNYLKRAEQLILEGADIIDIGAQSTRPGATVLNEKEETDRLITAVEIIRKEFPQITLSVDTYRANIADKAIEAGANIINDISGGMFDENIFKVAGKHNVPYILTHIQGTPQTMQKNPYYENVTEEVKVFFEKQIELLHQYNTTKIIIDPGFGFGKTMQHNYQLLNQLGEFKSINAPLLVGISRKSMIWKLLDSTPNEALNGTTVVNTIALLKGAKILRVHDVKEAKEALTITNELFRN